MSERAEKKKDGKSFLLFPRKREREREMGKGGRGERRGDHMLQTAALCIMKLIIYNDGYESVRGTSKPIIKL